MFSNSTDGGRPEHGEQASDWRAWMQGLGRRIRSAREAIGVSQADLARAAGVSQGAISRLETGRGLATPLLVVMKTAMAIRQAGWHVAREAMPEEGAQLLESLARHVGIDGRFDQGGAGIDTDAVELVAAFRALPESERKRVLASLKAAAASVETSADGQRGAAVPDRG